MELPGKRRRRRPKRRFLDVVKEDMGEVGAKETDVEDRKMWKKPKGEEEMSLRHCNCLLFFVNLFTIFISCFVPCFLCLFLFFYVLLNFLILPPCLPVSFSFPKCHSQTVSAVFLSIFAVLSHSLGNLSLPPRILVTSCLNAS